MNVYRDFLPVDFPPPCVVCGVAGNGAYSVTLGLARGNFPVLSFLFQNGVLPSSDTKWDTQSSLCATCFDVVARCDEFQYGFLCGVGFLKEKAAAFYSCSVGGVGEVAGSDVETKPPSILDAPSPPVLPRGAELDASSPSLSPGAAVDLMTDCLPEPTNEPDPLQLPLALQQEGVPPEQPASKPKPKPKRLSAICPICGVTAVRGQYKTHFKTAHPDLEFRSTVLAEFLQCPSCPFKTRKKTWLAQHLKNKHDVFSDSGGGKGFPCPDCSKVFKARPTLDTHLHKAHGKEKTFQCDKCDRTCVSEPHLKQHVLAVHVKKSVTRICEECGQEFPLMRYYQHAQTKHRERRKYTCEHCGVMRFTVRGYNNHLAKEHGTGEVKTRRFKRECTECGKWITSGDVFHAHVFKKHGIETSGLRRLKCEVCEVVSHTKSDFKTHMRIHTGERHVCPECGYSTRFITNLIKHRRHVHGKEPRGNDSNEARVEDDGGED